MTNWNFESLGDPEKDQRKIKYQVPALVVFTSYMMWVGVMFQYPWIPMDRPEVIYNWTKMLTEKWNADGVITQMSYPYREPNVIETSEKKISTSQI
jgi:hypothetical protein